MRLVVVFTLLAAAFSGTTNAQIQKLHPVDEAVRDPEFFTFRARLMQAVQRRDATFLIGILAPDIKNSFGGDGGIPEFRQTWKPETAQSKIWIELATALSLGGAFGADGSFSAPYTFAKWPEAQDAFEAGAIIAGNVRVRAAPQITSSVMTTLSFDIVEVTDWQTNQARGEKRNWVKIKLNDGKYGYVAEEFIRSPIDYRAVFEKKNGRWLMAAFIAGD